MRSAEFRVFLSSTFRDLQPEREQLVKKVFPRLRAVCRERGVEFTEIDLRWGITAEESRSGKAVRICLDEIGKCAPYFIGILGSRYGWAPGLDELQKDGECLERYPWLEELGREHKSITEMEITHGALHRDTTDSAFFYEQVSRLDDIPDYEREKFDSLKHRIRERGFACRMFASPEELGEHVYRDILSLLDRDYPIEQELTPVELERAPHLAYSVNRRRSYVANPEYLRRFEAHVDSDDIPLILWGRSGLGKSALVAYLTHEYKKQHPDAFVISHFIGAAAAGSDPEDVMRQVMMEIKERYALDDEIPQDDQKIREEFPAWLAKVQNEKLILAIDALNQLTGVAEELHWLPEFIPSHVRLVVSTTPGHTLEQLRKHQWQELELQPLDVPTRERIANEYLLQYNKKLTPEQLAFIANDPKCESPLFLRTLIEELRVFGRHTTLDEHIASYLASAGERELFARILARMEDDFGETTVRSVMQTIYASRYGLSQTELYGITKLSQLALSEFLIALEYHLMQRSGLYTFFHNYLREAVEARYLATDADLRTAHRVIAEYWTTQPYTTRRRDEEPWQWHEAGDWEAFKACIADIPMLELLLDEDRLQEIIGYWVVLQEHFDLVSTYRDAMDAFRAESSDDEKVSTLSGKLGNALVSASHYKEAEQYLRSALETTSGLHGTLSPEAAVAMNDLATLLYHTGSFTEAEKLLREVIEIRKRVLAEDNPLIAKAFNDLGAIQYSEGKLDDADESYKHALERYQLVYKHDHPEVASAWSNLGTIAFFKRGYDIAIDYFAKAVTMYTNIYGANDIHAISPTANLAMAYMETEEFEKAETLFLLTISMIRSTYGLRHILMSNSFVNLGVLYSRMNRFDEAISMHSQALEIYRRLLGEDHYLTLNSQLSIGMNRFRNGQHELGRNIVDRYLPLQREKLGANHQMYRVQENAWNELLVGTQKRGQ